MKLGGRRMRFYLVEKICDFEYGCREVVRAFSSRKSAKDYINRQPDNCDVKFWEGTSEHMYEITMFEVEEWIMLMKIAHYNDGKEKWESHTCYLFNDANDYHDFDITNIRGYGETKEEAVDNLKKELEYYFNELHALEKMLYETDILDNDIVEIDCIGRGK